MKRLFLAFNLVLAALTGSGPAHSETLQQYAAQCSSDIGAAVPAFSCLNGTIIPMGGPEGGPCNEPSLLNGRCHKYSRLGRLPSSNPDIDMVFLCRHYTAATGPMDPIFNDIAVIQHNVRTGATCFYQSPSGGVSLDGANVPAPAVTAGAIWQQPATTMGQSCVGCHDNGPFIRSPFLRQVQGADALPTRRSPHYFFPGQDFSAWKVYSVDTTGGNVCTGCHVMGWSNQAGGGRGTTLDLGRRSVGTSPTLNLVNGVPVWMPYSTTELQRLITCVNTPTAAGCVVRERTRGTTGPGPGPGTTVPQELKTSEWDALYNAPAGQVHNRVRFTGDTGTYATTNGGMGRFSGVTYAVVTGGFRVSGEWAFGAAHGTFVFTMDTGLTRFQGTYVNNGQTGNWNGQRHQSGNPNPGPGMGAIEHSRWNSVYTAQNGQNISAAMSLDGANGTYGSQGQLYQLQYSSNAGGTTTIGGFWSLNGSRGTINLTVDASGRAFSGRWTQVAPNGQVRASGTWTGTR